MNNQEILERQAQLMHTLFVTYDLPIDIETLKDMITVGKFEVMMAYLEDISVAIWDQSQGFLINVATIDHDEEWAKDKLRLFYKKFKVGTTQ